MDIYKPGLARNSSRSKNRGNSSKKQSMINFTTKNEIKNGNKLAAYNLKTIASRHTRHKSMLCNMVPKK